MARYGATGRGARTHVLNQEQKDLLLEWFTAGLSTPTIRNRMQLFNDSCASTGHTQFPDICLATITYHRRKMKATVDKAINEELANEELVVRRGLRHRDERIKRLEYAAECLEPYLGHANIKGVFSASEQYVTILRAIREECEPRGATTGQGLDPSVIKNLPIDMVRRLADEYKKGIA